MMRLGLLVLCSVALAACEDMPATGGLDAKVDNAANFDNAVASIGCELKFESDYLAVELQTGMSREEIQTIAASKVRKGQASALDGGGVRSDTGACAPDATPKQS